MKWIFNSFYILENKPLFIFVAILTIFIILLAVFFVIKELKENVNE